MIMTHPGLPHAWGLAVLVIILLTVLWGIWVPAAARSRNRVFSLATLPVLGDGFRSLVRSRWVLFSLRLTLVAIFLLVIGAGLLGTPIPERNIATVLTWNLWWSGLVFSVFFLGSAWCAVCPWETLSQWLVKRRIWKRPPPGSSLDLRVPRALRNIWPALFMFIGLTWLELGIGITLSPFATAAVALFMVVLATVSLAIFERNAFCRYFCPVGRTIGAYSQLSAIELRPVDAETCAHCRTLDCYHGNEEVEPCPTWLVMGRLTQNNYCTSCGNCAQSCPHDNVAWRLRSPAVEALDGGRPHWDEAWFVVGLLALTGFHGLTMMPFWEQWMMELGRFIGDTTGRQIWSFSIGLVAVMLVISGLYALAILLTQRLTGPGPSFRRVFSTYAFAPLPLAFSYHMAHNLNHLVREGAGMGAVFLNPFGTGTLPLSMMEKHARHLHMWISQDTLFALQAGLMVLGSWMAVQIVRYRGRAVAPVNRLQQIPVLIFVMAITGFHLWLLMQPMTMRM